jgi:hypothetical protein
MMIVIGGSGKAGRDRAVTLTDKIVALEKGTLSQAAQREFLRRGRRRPRVGGCPQLMAPVVIKPGHACEAA